MTRTEGVRLVFRVSAAAAFTRLAVVGDAVELGAWDAAKSVQLECLTADGKPMMSTPL